MRPLRIPVAAATALVALSTAQAQIPTVETGGAASVYATTFATDPGTISFDAIWKGAETPLLVPPAVSPGEQVRALSPLRGLRPDGTPVEMPLIEVLREGGGGRVRFLPSGRGLVYMQGNSPSQDFFLLDLASLESRHLTRLEDHATMRTFDVTPDGSEIVFDRLRRNSDLVLIDFEGGSDPDS